MSYFRDFSSSDEFQPRARDISNEAPDALRQELVDLIFHIVETNAQVLQEERIHRILCQSIGKAASAEPHGGFRYAAGRDLARADWQRVYDLIIRLWPEFLNAGLHEQYRESVNRILAGHRVVWELDEDGRLHRVVPIAAGQLIAAAMAELGDPRFAPALALLYAAVDAFDDRPRRDRDACANVFDCMESVAKEVFQMPTATFGAVVAHVRQAQAMQAEVISVLESVNTLRNRKFGHGMTVPFDLSPAEVDFTYLTCIGAVLLFARL